MDPRRCSAPKPPGRGSRQKRVLRGWRAPRGDARGHRRHSGVASSERRAPPYDPGTRYGASESRFRQSGGRPACSPPGTAIATGSPDTRARTWLSNGKPVSILAGHGGAINSVAFSPNGRLVLTASEDGTARLWNSSTEADLALVARQAPITAFA